MASGRNASTFSHDAYNGSIQANPYNFESYNMNKLQVFRNGLSIPQPQGFTDMVADKYQQVYNSTMKAINSPLTFSINKSDYAKGRFIIAVDLTNDWSANNPDYLNPQVDGTLRVTIDYDEALEDSIALFCIGEFTEQVTISGRGESVAYHLKYPTQ